MSHLSTDLEALRAKINERIQTLYPEGPENLLTPVAYVSAGQGKRLRPLLTLLSAKAFGGSIEAALPAAVAIEVLHNFTLVHDDIMDNDDLRHGQQSVHAKWDDNVAILTGDVLFVLALQELRRSAKHVDQLTEAFAAGALAVCEGQALDLAFETNGEVTVAEYLNMIDLKTGHLLGLAAELGAISADGDESAIIGARTFGRLLGRAFQIQDDLLEVYSDADTMGKSLGSDLVAGKKTYLYLAANDRVPERVAEAKIVAVKNVENGVNMFREILEKTGIREEADSLIRETIDAALMALAPVGPGKVELEAFAEIVLRRKN